MTARLCTYISAVVLTAICYGATPETASVPDGTLHMSMELRSPAKYASPNLRVIVDANCSDMPLRDYLSNVAKQSGVAIFLDERPFANTQTAFGKLISIKVGEQISLDSALNLALEPLHLAHYIKDGKVVVTNKSFVVSPKFDFWRKKGVRKAL